VAAYNAGARTGRDPEFSKGENAYDRSQGDPRWQPNPCVGPLDQPPFYAVEIRPGDLGTFAGLRTDAAARVLDGTGAPIPGLFAVGNDQASVFGGAYPGGGATIGPGLTFAYIAGRTLAGAN
jgi:predicted oxidoreductase